MYDGVFQAYVELIRHQGIERIPGQVSVGPVPGVLGGYVLIPEEEVHLLEVAEDPRDSMPIAGREVEPDYQQSGSTAPTAGRSLGVFTSAPGQLTASL